MAHAAAKLTVIVLTFAVLSLSSGAGSAAFLPPSAWQSTGQSSAKALAIGQALQQSMQALSSTGAELDDTESAALQTFYAERGHKALWLVEGRLTAKGEALTAALRDAFTHALPADDYAFALKALEALGPNAPLKEQVAAEITLSSAALLYARHATAGIIEPAILGENTTIDPKPIDPAGFLQDLADRQATADVLASLHPAATDYEPLRQAYLAMLKSARKGEWIKVPDGKSLKPGESASRVPVLRQRLAQGGYLPAAAAGDESDLYDDTLAEAVKTFQKRHGLASEGVVGPNTLKALNMSKADRVRQLALNLERRRWLAEDLGARHIFVNQANFRMQLMDEGKAIFDTRVVVGKPKHQTPVFSDTMEYIELNPYWNVPKSIVVNEYLPHLLQNPLALSGMGIEMFARQGGERVQVDPREIDWTGVTEENYDLLLRQPPSSANSLGQVKFMFPNKHHVYLHDTPSRSLFNRQHRAYSHGCVRVKNPMKFAEILMEREGWTRNKLDEILQTGENTRINLKRRVPVHLTYWTAWIDEAGEVNTRPDVYERDTVLATILGLDENALKLAELTSH